jgi:ribulose-bisphosphate carboxylase large chain
MEKEISFCDLSIQGKKKKSKPTNRTRFYKHRGGCTWQGIKTEEYKTKGSHWTDVLRRFIIGNHQESAKFHLRYFEISPGGFTSFEKHKHEHVVIGIRGKGKVFCGKPESIRTRKQYEMNFLDTLYIAPDTPHQLSNPFQEPFGFFCIVNAKRDKPKMIKKGFKDSRVRGFEENIKESKH